MTYDGDENKFKDMGSHDGFTTYDSDEEIDMGIQSKKSRFFDKLKEKTDKIKDQGLKIGKTAVKGAGDIGNNLDNAIDGGVNAAKGVGTSKDEILDLLERLANMREKGILTEKEFTQKKKDLLERI